MNLVQFMKSVEDEMADMTKEQLQSYLLELARTLPESQRTRFLDTMQNTKREQEATTYQVDKQQVDIQAEVKEMMDILTRIDDGERCLSSEYNEEWDDWYNSDAEEILFSDPDKVLVDLEKAVDLLHKCVDRELYKEGYELAELLSVMRIMAEGDYQDYSGEDLKMQELYDYDLMSGSFEQVVEESLYVAYMGNVLSTRTDALYWMVSNYGSPDVTLESVMQRGNQQLPEFKEFLVLWVNYLGGQSGRGVKRLMQEAVELLGDDMQMLEISRSYVKQHPELYMQLIRKGMGEERWQEMLPIGLEALESISVTYILRSEIALLTAECADKVGDVAIAEKCWVEAFRSDSSLVNYLRIYFLSGDWKQYRSQVKQIYEEIYYNTVKTQNSMTYYENQQQTNWICKHTYCTFLFFDGEFEQVIQQGMKVRTALGWSSTFMKEGLALFLLLLYQGEKYPSGLEAMLRRAMNGCGFVVDLFLKGTPLKKETDTLSFFGEILDKWKKEVSVSEVDASKWLEMIEKSISMRTEGIMEANRRNYYGECAAFIAAYGEVCESRGSVGAKSRIMEQYKTKYSRRSAFHKELRSFGMRK